MTDFTPRNDPAARSGCSRVLLGAGLVLLVLSVAGGGYRWWSVRQALREQQARAEEQFGPVFDKLDEAVRSEQGPGYDIDETIKVIHEIDLALQESESLGDWLQQMARRDYHDVAPEVLAARKELMEVLFEIYAKQAEIEDQEEMWGLTSELLLSALSVVGGDADLGPLGPSGTLQVDREQARALLEQLKERQDARLQLGRDERALENKLIDRLVAYADVYHRYVEEWDRLCTVRDRAYLAVANADWDTAVSAADAAIAMAPHEREAHILKALALIESGRIADPETAGDVERLLAEYIDRHPDRTAPAFLLRGVLHARLGDLDAARLDLQQAAAYYPRQADALGDMLDPYRMRSYLRKTREGSYVIELYKSTMLGAGYMSPDLQQARLLFDAGDFEGGRAKVLDHFSRRRAQEQWDFLLSDIEFAQVLLGEDFRRIFPEDQYLDLVVKPGLIGSRLSVGVRNRSDRTLHNATLVLALHFTDMHPDDYEPVVAGDTRPAVLAHETTDFGSVEIDFDLWGKHKSVDDIVTHRAILVANEAVLWVDTDEYKIAEAREFHDPDAATAMARAEAEARAAVAAGGRSRHGLVERILADARSGSSIRIDDKALLKDGVTITLPKELAVLRPLFRLQYGDEVFTADDNLIVGDRIELRFDSVDDFGSGEHRGDQLQLVASTVLGDLVWTWGPEGGSRFRLINVVGQGG
ncbi:MAG: hypothetical protein D6798_16110 [Deltaproteobacteria bacterium]|nr:MAG: hypothetical protein D6798_16110 [Deltaproteobacteria bacterium]